MASNPDTMAFVIGDLNNLVKMLEAGMAAWNDVKNGKALRFTIWRNEFRVTTLVEKKSKQPRKAKPKKKSKPQAVHSESVDVGV
jgi:hypothetical protein